MMAEIEAGHIGVVIVKDMSRFGRDYLQVGYYTEMLSMKRPRKSSAGSSPWRQRERAPGRLRTL